MDLLDTLTLFGTVVLAAPIGLLGAEFLLGGRVALGVGFLVVAVGLVIGGYFRPSLKGIVAGTVTDAVGDEGDDNRTDGNEGDDNRTDGNEGDDNRTDGNEGDEEAYKG